MLAVLAAAFMCLATFHGAAHAHDGDDHDETHECAAFHLVAQTPIAPPADISVGIELSNILVERLSLKTAVLDGPAHDRLIFPRGPPLQSFAI